MASAAGPSLGLCSIFTRSAERCIALQERDWAEQFCTTQLPEVAKARAEALEDATVTTTTAEAAYDLRTLRGASRTGSTRPRRHTAAPRAALADLEAAEAAEERARAPVNFPKNYRSPRTALTCTPTRRGVARHEAGERDHLGRQGELLQHDRPGAHGRQQAWPQRLWARQAPRDWIRKRRPDLLPVARLIVGTPSFIRLVKAEGALRLPSADGDDLDFSAADWDPLSLECPDYNDPNYPSPPAGSSRDVRCLPSSASASSTRSATPSSRKTRVRPLGLEGGVREARRPRQNQVPHRPRRLPD